MRRVAILPQAQADLDTITDPLFSVIMDQIQTLRIYPRLGQRFEGPFIGYRWLIVGVFRIVYRIDDEQIEIAYVLHGRRQLPVDKMR